MGEKNFFSSQSTLADFFRQQISHTLFEHWSFPNTLPVLRFYYSKIEILLLSTLIPFIFPVKSKDLVLLVKSSNFIFPWLPGLTSTLGSFDHSKFIVLLFFPYQLLFSPYMLLQAFSLFIGLIFLIFYPPPSPLSLLLSISCVPCL